MSSTSSSRMLLRIVGALGAGGVASLGCGGAVASPDTRGDDDTTGSSAGSGAASGAGGADATPGAAGGGGGGGGSSGSAGEGGASTASPPSSGFIGLPSESTGDPEVLGEIDPEGYRELCAPLFDEYHVTGVCLTHPEGMTCAEARSIEAIESQYSCGLIQRANAICEVPPPDEMEACCYVLAGGCAVGRPFLVDGTARVAPLAARRDFAADVRPQVHDLDDATRRALADAWSKSGATEHASVAAFGRFALECLALGAPADIVAAAHRAALDEIEHARLAFGLASTYRDEPVGPGNLALDGALAAAPDPLAFVRALVREACIAETVSAQLIAAARDAATDPVVRRCLARVAEEETDHVLLGWRTLRWAIATWGAPALRAATKELLRPEPWVGFGATTELPGDERAMRRHGYLSIAERRTIAQRTLTEVVGPAARLLSDAEHTAQSRQHGDVAVV